MARKRSGRRRQSTKKTDVARTEATVGTDEDVKAQLEQQNQLVEQLTEQLNDANQRLQQAADHPTVPTDHSEQILECVTTLLSRSDELQPAKLFQRLEDKIDDLRSRGAAIPDAPLKRPQTKAPAQSDGSWEQIRSTMLHEAGIEVKVEEEPEEDDALSGVVPPEPIDMDTANLEDLKLAVERRDAYAVCLLHQIRVIERRKLITAEELREVADLPEEMTSSLSELERRLEEVLRMTEVELSIERARVSRESVKLLAEQSQLARQQALVNEQREAMDMAPATPAKSNRKWLNALGFAKD